MAKIKLPTIFSQLDTRWGNEMLGHNAPGTIYNIYNFGCTITCHSMIAQYIGENINPSSINDLFKKNGGFSNGGLYVWGSMQKLFKKVIREYKVNTPSPLTDAQYKEIRSAIDRGFPVLLQIDVNPKTVQLDMHYVLCIGYNPDDENDLTIADPIGGVERSLKHYLGWFRPRMRNTIEQYCIYEVEVPQNTSLKDTIIDFDDGEKKRKTVGWYVYEWYTEKVKKLDLIKEYEDKLKKKDDFAKDLISKHSEQAAEITRKENKIGQMSVTISNQKTEIARLRTENASLLTIGQLVMLIIEKLKMRKA